MVTVLQKIGTYGPRRTLHYLSLCFNQHPLIIFYTDDLGQNHKPTLYIRHSKPLAANPLTNRLQPHTIAI